LPRWVCGESGRWDDDAPDSGILPAHIRKRHNCEDQQENGEQTPATPGHTITWERISARRNLGNRDYPTQRSRAAL